MREPVVLIAMLYTSLVSAAATCVGTPSPNCGDPSTLCFSDERCAFPALDPTLGVGCSAGGVSRCRFCAVGSRLREGERPKAGSATKEELFLPCRWPRSAPLPPSLPPLLPPPNLPPSPAPPSPPPNPPLPRPLRRQPLSPPPPPLAVPADPSAPLPASPPGFVKGGASVDEAVLANPVSSAAVLLITGVSVFALFRRRRGLRGKGGAGFARVTPTEPADDPGEEDASRARVGVHTRAAATRVGNERNRDKGRGKSGRRTARSDADQAEAEGEAETEGEEPGGRDVDGRSLRELIAAARAKSSASSTPPPSDTRASEPKGVGRAQGGRAKGGEAGGGRASGRKGDGKQGARGPAQFRAAAPRGGMRVADGGGDDGTEGGGGGGDCGGDGGSCGDLGNGGRGMAAPARRDPNPNPNGQQPTPLEWDDGATQVARESSRAGAASAIAAAMVAASGKAAAAAAVAELRAAANYTRDAEIYARDARTVVAQTLLPGGGGGCYDSRSSVSLADTSFSALTTGTFRAQQWSL